MNTRIKLRCFAGQHFGDSVVIDPEVRKPAANGKQRRYVLMRCACKTVYLAPISHLYQGRYQTCANCSKSGAPRKTAVGRVHRNRSGWIVSLHVGWYKSRTEADDIARRSRAVIMPAVPPHVQ